MGLLGQRRFTCGLLVAFLVAGGAADALAQQVVSLKDLNAGPGAFKDRVIEVRGFVKVWEEDRSQDVAYFVLEDNYGYAVRVRTTQGNPGRGRTVTVRGLLNYDPVRQPSFFLDERERVGADMGGSAVAPGSSTVLIVAVALGGLVLIGLGIWILRSVQRPPAAPAIARVGGGSVEPILDRTVKVDHRQFSYQQPLDTTYRILPGALQILGDQPQTIKLFQVGAEPVFTFGRKPGPAMTHIELKDPTVSAKQAELKYLGGKFYLINQSSTNPTVVAGRKLSPNESVELQNGAEIVMGEMRLKFEQRERAA